MKKLTLSGQVQGDRIVYAEGNWREQFEKFKADNDGKFFEATYRVVDGARHHQYRYLFGFVYPAIAEAQGERDIDAVHLILKQQFHKYPASSISEIEHKKRAIIIMDGPDVIGYIRSLSTLDKDEMRDYILKCEGIRDGLIDWTLPADAMNFRRRAME